MNKMLRVGVTGRSGSGKSLITAHYASLGYPTVDGDAISREIVLPGSQALQELVAVFGQEILAKDGSLIRAKLAALAFATPENNQKLVSITHPHIIARFLQLAEEARRGGAFLFFMDGAMIVGQILQPYCDKLIVVTAPHQTSVYRTMLRDGISQQAAEARLASQLPQEVLCAAADYVIDNSSSKQELLQKANSVLKHLIKRG